MTDEEIEEAAVELLKSLEWYRNPTLEEARGDIDKVKEALKDAIREYKQGS